MSLFNDIDWTEKGKSSDCVSYSKRVSDYAKRLPRGHWSFFGPGEEDKWHGTHTCKPEGKWDSVADLMIELFKESGHPMFRGISAFNRGILKKKRWKIHDSIYFGIFEFRASISHTSFGKSAQYLWSIRVGVKSYPKEFLVRYP